MVKINWTPQSSYDIDNIAEFIAKDSEKYAKIQTTWFFNSVKILISHPKAGRIVPEISQEKIWELINGNYRMVNRIIDETHIDILTINHSKRLLSNNPIFEEDI